MSGRKNKFFALILGIISSLVLLEIVLRLMGSFIFPSAGKISEIKKEKGEHVILCLGDSFTHGIGARKGESYPDQLQQIFDKRCPDKKIRVINKGVGGFNSAKVLEAFNANIDRFKPEVVIILAGTSNEWNSYGYCDYLNGESSNNPIRDFLYRIKVFKLMKLFIYNLNHEVRTPFKHAKSPEFMELINNGTVNEREGKLRDALACFNEAVEKDPNSYVAYWSLGRVHANMGHGKAARSCLKKAIEINPQRDEAYVALEVCSLQYPSKNKEDLEFVKQYINVNPFVKDIIKKAEGEQEYVSKLKIWIEHDLEIMIKGAKDRGIRIIMQNYPDYGREPWRHKVNAILRDIAQKNRVFFLDNEQIFSSLLSGGVSKNDYFAFDHDHCNDKGYGVMANKLYDLVMENNLISSGNVAGN